MMKNSEKNIKKLFKNLTIRYIIQITRRKRAKDSIKRRNLYEARKEEFDRRETLQISL